MRVALLVVLLGLSLAGLIAWLDGRPGGRGAVAGPSVAPPSAKDADDAPAARVRAPGATRARLEPSEPHGSDLFVGRCLDGGGLPLEGVLVRALEPLEESATSDAAGHYELAFDATRVERSSAELAFSLPGHATKTLRSPRGARGRVLLGALRLERGGALRGRLMAADGSAAGDALVVATGDFPGRSYSRSTTSDAGGHWELAGLRHGTYELNARWLGAREREPLRFQLDGLALDVGDVHLTPVDEGRLLRGRVYGLDGLGAPGVEIRFVNMGRGAGHHGTLAADRDGQFTLLGHSRQEYELRAGDPETGALSDTLRATCGGPELAIRLEPPPPAPLYVTDQDGAPVTEFSCQVSDPATSPDPTSTPAIAHHPGGLVHVPEVDRPVALTLRAHGFQTLVVPSISLRSHLSAKNQTRPPAPVSLKRRPTRVTTLGSNTIDPSEVVYVVRLTRTSPDR